MTPSGIPLEKGEVLRLGSREITVTVDPRKTGSPFVIGTQALLPGASICPHRFLNHEHVLFVYKGQGRATVEGKAIILTPGVMVYVPRATWQDLRNTGTGSVGEGSVATRITGWISDPSFQNLA